MTATSTHRAIKAVWRIESARLIALLPVALLAATVAVAQDRPPGQGRPRPGVPAVRSPEVTELYMRGGFDLKATTGEEHAILMKESYDRWGAIIHSLNITLE